MEKEQNFRRVTEILYPFSGMDKIPPEVLAKAANRGTRVHTVCEAIMQGLGEIGVDDEIRPYVESFKQWWNDEIKIKAIELRFYDKELMITGQVDMIAEMPDGLAIIDIKTSYKPSKTWQVQGSAYAYLARKSGYDVKRLYFLHLDRHGGAPNLIEYEIDIPFFLDVLRVFNHFYGG